ncbi:MAG: rod shape-determining protein MreD [Flavobacterium sp.]|jgi:rod shape-determining protein MreD|uniref:rod shape-determining protein MreD n=1 Tax=Flavobacterium sp. TaxID=239 RepID=UPI001B6EEE66|nr:rod shape-determining protein MreD [Flavobacterium sp.]MBA4153167.1 rod shape-determining protein MreD [Flavobacterium sp.]MBP6585681.1 rod shape-determining protein MreD [Flavobacterium sp.]
MSSAVIVNIIRFILLILAQVAIFNKINFLGFINPYPYILFIILYPVNGNKNGLLLASFLLGITMDMFSNSGGVHAAACVTLAYLRPSFFKFSFGLSYEYQTVKINERLTPERFSFILISVLTHHIILFLLEIFRFSFFWNILLRTVLSTIFTLALCILLIYLFKPSKKN